MLSLYGRDRTAADGEDYYSLDENRERGCATGAVIFISFVVMVLSAVLGVFQWLFSGGSIPYGWGVVFIVTALVFLAAIGVID